jgi:hypothetical protein
VQFTTTEIYQPDYCHVVTNILRASNLRTDREETTPILRLNPRPLTEFSPFSSWKSLLLTLTIFCEQIIYATTSSINQFVNKYFYMQDIFKLATIMVVLPKFIISRLILCESHAFEITIFASAVFYFQLFDFVFIYLPPK